MSKINSFAKKYTPYSKKSDIAAKNMFTSNEETTHQAIVRWLGYHAPDNLIVVINPYAGMKMTQGQAAKAKRMGLQASQPDFIFIGATKTQKAGLAIELKAKGTVIFNKDGSLRANAHLHKQAAYLARLQENGFEAHFAVGFDEFVRLFHTYYDTR